MIYTALDVAVAPTILIPLGIIFGVLLLVAGAAVGIVFLIRKTSGKKKEDNQNK